MKKIWIGAGLLGLVAMSAVALAQTYPPAKVVSVGPNDLVQIIPGGVGTVPSVYATAAQITNVPGYHNLGTVSGDPAYHLTNGITNVFGHGAGTITAVTLTLPPNPGDGAHACYWLDQVTTTLTWAANTGQTVDGNVHAAGAQYISNCVTFQASTSSWISSN